MAPISAITVDLPLVPVAQNDKVYAGKRESTAESQARTKW